MYFVFHFMPLNVTHWAFLKHNVSMLLQEKCVSNFSQFMIRHKKNVNKTRFKKMSGCNVCFVCNLDFLYASTGYKVEV